MTDMIRPVWRAAAGSAVLLAALLLAPTSALAQGSLPLSGEHDLVRGLRYTSASGAHALVYQDDGNLVVYTAAGQPTWALQEVGVDYRRTGRVALQADGNLAIYAADGAYLWSALTADPDPSAQLGISPRGALQLVSSGRGVLWSSDGDLSSPTSASAQPGSWRVHEGTPARHSFGRTVPNGDNEGLLSGAQIPASSDRGWSRGSTDLSLQWSGPGGTPCRSQANYTYFEAVLHPADGDGYEIEFASVDDVARASVIAGTGTIHIPEVIGLRERKTIDLTPFLEPGTDNRVVVTLADVCGAGNGIRAQLRRVPGGAEPTAVAETMTVDGTVIQTGNVQVTLQWDGPVDLDLYVADPDGDEVSYLNTSVASGGELDVDARAGCSQTPETVENIIWRGTPPRGAYTIRVDYYEACDEGPVPYTATLRRAGQVVETWTGTLTYGNTDTHSFSVAQ